MHPTLRYKRILKGFLIVLAGGTLFVGGLYAGTHTSFAKFITTQKTTASDGSFTEKDLSAFWNVWQTIESKYVFPNTPTETEKIYGAIAGMVASYNDPYTVFFPPKEAKLFNDQVRGSFGGVGIELGIKNNTLTVIAPIKDSPADKAGILAGDIIVEIDTKKTETFDIETAVSLIRGEIGTTINLGIARKNAGEIKNFSLVRDIVKLPVLETEEKNDVFIINFYNFSENSTVLFTKALETFISSGKHKLIIDLRNNPGGYLDAAVDIASYFIPAGKPLVRENLGPNTVEKVEVSKGYTLLKNLKKNPEIVVLINGGSASASEILAGALEEYGVAKTVGTTSFGKGSVQELIKFKDQSSLKVTIAKWLTPKGISISEKGITPNHIIEDKPVLNKQTNEYSDPQMEAALKLLK